MWANANFICFETEVDVWSLVYETVLRIESRMMHRGWLVNFFDKFHSLRCALNV